MFDRIHTLALTVLAIPYVWVEPFTWGYRMQGFAVPI